MSDHYKISIGCNRSTAERINQQLEIDNQWADIDPPPTIVTRELVEFDDNQWAIDIYLTGMPNKAIFSDIETLIGKMLDSNIPIEKFVDEDWLTLSQIGLEAISIGSFYIHSEAEPPIDGKHNLCISAGQAFGTGHHETTSGCLLALEGLYNQDMQFAHIADIGTGTGLLAFAAQKLWPSAQIIASDIDPIAIDFAKDAAVQNSMKMETLKLLQASGTDHQTIQDDAPYQLLIANILAGPLIELAPAFDAILDKGGVLILAGLIKTQVENIINAYEACEMQLLSNNPNGNWPILMFKKTNIYDKNQQGHASVMRRTSQKDGDYGEW